MKVENDNGWRGRLKRLGDFVLGPQTLGTDPSVGGEDTVLEAFVASQAMKAGTISGGCDSNLAFSLMTVRFFRDHLAEFPPEAPADPK